MKRLQYIFLAFVILTGMSVVASAAVTCGSGGGTNISSSGGTVCSLGGLTFTFQAPGFTPTSTADALSITAASIIGNDYVLEFGISPGTAGFPVDISIDYLVQSTSTNISGIDAEFPGGASGTILEQACGSPLTGTALCSERDTISVLDLTTGGLEVSGTPATFGPVSQVSIHKDIDAITFSEFTDSIRVSPSSSVPEPSTILLLGSVLCGLGLVSRKLRGRS